MLKKNQVVIVAPKGGFTPRLAVVRSVRRDGTVNCMFAMYKNSNIFTDYVCNADDTIATRLTWLEFESLATCYANQDPLDASIVRQRALDAQYPEYAAMRKDYAPRESIAEGMRRRRAERMAA
jgi:hypothetical protein